jgi:hypothetical protein
MNGTLFAVMIIGAVIGAAVASSKNRNVIGWMFAGAVFPVISVIAILCLPAVEAPDPSTTT